jgi:hypothetical protein
VRSLVPGDFRPTELNSGLVEAWVWPAIVATGVIVYALPNIYEILRDEDPAIHTFENRSITPTALRVRWRSNVAWALLAMALFITALARINLPLPFLYGGF